METPINIITRADIHPICTTRLASVCKALHDHLQFKNLIAVHDLDTGETKFIVDAQFQPAHTTGWRTVNKSYTILETAIAKYNKLQF